MNDESQIQHVQTSPDYTAGGFDNRIASNFGTMVVKALIVTTCISQE
jgi:hypothetical protein